MITLEEIVGEEIENLGYIYPEHEMEKQAPTVIVYNL
jgi:hypothetical protein